MTQQLKYTNTEKPKKWHRKKNGRLSAGRRGTQLMNTE
jgi:hypothetical protein